MSIHPSIVYIAYRGILLYTLQSAWEGPCLSAS
jgi:hypothetical protein